MSQKGGIKPQMAPNLNLPKGSTSVEVSIIDTTTDITCPADGLIQPTLPGNEYLNLPTYAYLIKHPSGKQILFDLGSRKDWWNFSKYTYQTVIQHVAALNVAKGIDEVLSEGGVSVQDISSVIWSHWHWDHTGDPSLFPPSTELVVGPGVKDTFIPGYPTNPNAILLDSDFANRSVREIDFSGSPLDIGGFEGFDFFGDGSFYLLNSRGHAIGHMSALARTTDSTFVLLGGDVCHHGGSFRPTSYAPMPETIPSDVPLDSKRFRSPCPCAVFTACHPDPENARTKHYFHVSRAKDSWYVEPDVAQQSIDRVELFDADENVFVALAHDEGLGAVCELFPKATMNGWKEKGRKERERWAFLNAMPVDGKPARGFRYPGLMREGVVVERKGMDLPTDWQ